MKKEDMIKQITEKTSWGDERVKENALDELEQAALDEGCEWGEQAPQIIELYRRLQRDYISKEFAQAVHNEIINLYLHMLEWTEIVEYPEKEEKRKVPAYKKREWTY